MISGFDSKTKDEQEQNRRVTFINSLVNSVEQQELDEDTSTLSFNREENAEKSVSDGDAGKSFTGIDSEEEKSMLDISYIFGSNLSVFLYGNGHALQIKS